MSQSTQTAQIAQPRVVPPGAGTMAPAAAPGLPMIEVKLGAADAAGFSLVEYEVRGRFSPPPPAPSHPRGGRGLRAPRGAPLLVRGRVPRPGAAHARVAA